MLLHNPRKSFATIQDYCNWSGLSGHGWNTFWPIFLAFAFYNYVYLMQPTSRAYINDTSAINIIIEPINDTSISD